MTILSLNVDLTHERRVMGLDEMGWLCILRRWARRVQIREVRALNTTMVYDFPC